MIKIWNFFNLESRFNLYNKYKQMKLLVFLTLLFLAFSDVTNLTTSSQMSSSCREKLRQKISNSNGALVEVEKNGNYDMTCLSNQVSGKSTACVLKAECFNNQWIRVKAKITLSEDLAKVCCPSS